MWNNPSLFPDSAKFQSGSQEHSRDDDDFLSMFEADSVNDSEEASDTLCSRQVLLEESGDIGGGILLGDLVIFRHNTKELVKACADLTVSLAGSEYFDQTLHCRVLRAGQGLPLCLITTEKQTDQEALSSDDHNLLKILEKKKLRLADKKHQVTGTTPDELYSENIKELLNTLAVLTLIPEIDEKVSPQNVPFQAVALTRFVASDQKLKTGLLQHVNKLFAGTSVKAESVDHAMMLLGQGRFLCWLSARAILRLGQLCGRQGVALMALRRASLLSALTENSEAHFLAGTLSLLSALTGCELTSLAAALEQHPEQEPGGSENNIEFKADPNKLLGDLTSFSDKIELLEALEQADWRKLDSCLGKIGLTEKQLNKAFAEAVKWEGTL